MESIAVGSEGVKHGRVRDEFSLILLFQVAYIRIYEQHHTYGLGNVLFYEAGGAEGAKAAGRFLLLDHWAPTLASVILLPHWSHFAPYSLRL